MNKSLLILVLTICVLWANAQNPLQIDENLFSDEKIEAYKNLKIFQYKQDVPTTNSAWLNLRKRIIRVIQSFFSDEGALPTLRLVILVVAIAFILFRILGMKINTLFPKKQNEVTLNSFGEVSEIETINFENQANVAHGQQDYRLAVRFLFLHCLQILEKNNLIQWRPEKTNARYLRELRENQLFYAFKDIIYAYNSVWYGHFSINEKQFSAFRNKIDALSNSLNTPQST